jgi:hypothetical protein
MAGAVSRVERIVYGFGMQRARGRFREEIAPALVDQQLGFSALRRF